MADTLKRWALHALRPMLSKVLDESALNESLVGLEDGKLVLRNVQLNEDMLRGMADDMAPVKLRGVCIRTLSLQLSWTSLWNAPISIQADGVDVDAVLSQHTHWKQAVQAQLRGHDALLAAFERAAMGVKDTSKHAAKSLHVPEQDTTAEAGSPVPDVSAPAHAGWMLTLTRALSASITLAATDVSIRVHSSEESTPVPPLERDGPYVFIVQLAALSVDNVSDEMAAAAAGDRDEPSNSVAASKHVRVDGLQVACVSDPLAHADNVRDSPRDSSSVPDLLAPVTLECTITLRDRGRPRSPDEFAQLLRGALGPAADEFTAAVVEEFPAHLSPGTSATEYAAFLADPLTTWARVWNAHHHRSRGARTDTADAATAPAHAGGALSSAYHAMTAPLARVQRWFGRTPHEPAAPADDVTPLGTDGPVVAWVLACPALATHAALALAREFEQCAASVRPFPLDVALHSSALHLRADLRTLRCMQHAAACLKSDQWLPAPPAVHAAALARIDVCSEQARDAMYKQLLRTPATQLTDDDLMTKLVLERVWLRAGMQLHVLRLRHEHAAAAQGSLLAPKSVLQGVMNVLLGRRSERAIASELAELSRALGLEDVSTVRSSRASSHGSSPDDEHAAPAPQLDLAGGSVVESVPTVTGSQIGTVLCLDGVMYRYAPTLTLLVAVDAVQLGVDTRSAMHACTCSSSGNRSGCGCGLLTLALTDIALHADVYLPTAVSASSSAFADAQARREEAEAHLRVAPASAAAEASTAPAAVAEAALLPHATTMRRPPPKLSFSACVANLDGDIQLHGHGTTKLLSRVRPRSSHAAGVDAALAVGWMDGHAHASLCKLQLQLQPLHAAFAFTAMRAASLALPPLPPAHEDAPTQAAEVYAARGASPLDALCLSVTQACASFPRITCSAYIQLPVIAMASDAAPEADAVLLDLGDVTVEAAPMPSQQLQLDWSNVIISSRSKALLQLQLITVQCGVTEACAQLDVTAGGASLDFHTDDIADMLRIASVYTRALADVAAAVPRRASPVLEEVPSQSAAVIDPWQEYEAAWNRAAVARYVGVHGAAVPDHVLACVRVKLGPLDAVISTHSDHDVTDTTARFGAHIAGASADVVLAWMSMTTDVRLGRVKVVDYLHPSARAARGAPPLDACVLLLAPAVPDARHVSGAEDACLRVNVDVTRRMIADTRAAAGIACSLRSCGIIAAAHADSIAHAFILQAQLQHVLKDAHLAAVPSDPPAAQQVHAQSLSTDNVRTQPDPGSSNDTASLRVYVKVPFICAALYTRNNAAIATMGMHGFTARMLATHAAMTADVCLDSVAAFTYAPAVHTLLHVGAPPRAPSSAQAYLHSMLQSSAVVCEGGTPSPFPSRALRRSSALHAALRISPRVGVDLAAALRCTHVRASAASLRPVIAWILQVPAAPRAPAQQPISRVQPAPAPTSTQAQDATAVWPALEYARMRPFPRVCVLLTDVGAAWHGADAHTMARVSVHAAHVGTIGHSHTVACDASHVRSSFPFLTVKDADALTCACAHSHADYTHSHSLSGDAREETRALEDGSPPALLDAPLDTRITHMEARITGLSIQVMRDGHSAASCALTHARASADAEIASACDASLVVEAAPIVAAVHDAQAAVAGMGILAGEMASLTAQLPAAPSSSDASPASSQQEVMDTCPGMSMHAWLQQHPHVILHVRVDALGLRVAMSHPESDLSMTFSIGAVHAALTGDTRASSRVCELELAVDDTGLLVVKSGSPHDCLHSDAEHILGVRASIYNGTQTPYDAAVQLDVGQATMEIPLPLIESFARLAAIFTSQQPPSTGAMPPSPVVQHAAPPQRSPAPVQRHHRHDRARICVLSANVGTLSMGIFTGLDTYEGMYATLRAHARGYATCDGVADATLCLDELRVSRGAVARSRDAMLISRIHMHARTCAAMVIHEAATVGREQQAWLQLQVSTLQPIVLMLCGSDVLFAQLCWDALSLARSHSGQSPVPGTAPASGTASTCPHDTCGELLLQLPRVYMHVQNDLQAAELPVARADLHAVHVSARMYPRARALGRVSAHLSIDFFNTHTGVFEPVLEPWQLAASLSKPLPLFYARATGSTQMPSDTAAHLHERYDTFERSLQLEDAHGDGAFVGVNESIASRAFISDAHVDVRTSHARINVSSRFVNALLDFGSECMRAVAGNALGSSAALSASYSSKSVHVVNDTELPWRVTVLDAASSSSDNHARVDSLQEASVPLLASGGGFPCFTYLHSFDQWLPAHVYVHNDALECAVRADATLVTLRLALSQSSQWEPTIRALPFTSPAPCAYVMLLWDDAWSAETAPSAWSCEDGTVHPFPAHAYDGSAIPRAALCFTSRAACAAVAAALKCVGVEERSSNASKASRVDALMLDLPAAAPDADSGAAGVLMDDEGLRGRHGRSSTRAHARTASSIPVPSARLDAAHNSAVQEDAAPVDLLPFTDGAVRASAAKRPEQRVVCIACSTNAEVIATIPLLPPTCTLLHVRATESSSASVPVICESAVIAGAPHIYIRSCTVVCNTLSIPMRIQFTDAAAAVVRVVTLAPGSTTGVPLTAAADGFISMAPCVADGAASFMYGRRVPLQQQALERIYASEHESSLFSKPQVPASGMVLPMICQPSTMSEPGEVVTFVCALHVLQPKQGQLHSDATTAPYTRMMIIPSVRIQNLLPCTADARLDVLPHRRNATLAHSVIRDMPPGTSRDILFVPHAVSAALAQRGASHAEAAVMTVATRLHSTEAWSVVNSARRGNLAAAADADSKHPAVLAPLSPHASGSSLHASALQQCFPSHSPTVTTPGINTVLYDRRFVGADYLRYSSVLDGIVHSARSLRGDTRALAAQATHVDLYVPFWILNVCDTALEMAPQSGDGRDGLQLPSAASLPNERDGFVMYAGEAGSQRGTATAQRVQFKVASAASWSAGIDLRAIGAHQTVYAPLPSNDAGTTSAVLPVCITVSAAPRPFDRTRIVRVQPKYTIVNTTQDALDWRVLCLRQDGADARRMRGRISALACTCVRSGSAPPGATLALPVADVGTDRILYIQLRLSDTARNDWSEVVAVRDEDAQLHVHTSKAAALLPADADASCVHADVPDAQQAPLLRLQVAVRADACVSVHVSALTLGTSAEAAAVPHAVLNKCVAHSIMIQQDSVRFGAMVRAACNPANAAATANGTSIPLCLHAPHTDSNLVHVRVRPIGVAALDDWAGGTLMANGAAGAAAHLLQHALSHDDETSHGENADESSFAVDMDSIDAVQQHGDVLACVRIRGGARVLEVSDVSSAALGDDAIQRVLHDRGHDAHLERVLRERVDTGQLLLRAAADVRLALNNMKQDIVAASGSARVLIVRVHASSLNMLVDSERLTSRSHCLEVWVHGQQQQQYADACLQIPCGRAGARELSRAFTITADSDSVEVQLLLRDLTASRTIVAHGNIHVPTQDGIQDYSTVLMTRADVPVGSLGFTVCSAETEAHARWIAADYTLTQAVAATEALVAAQQRALHDLRVVGDDSAAIVSAESGSEHSSMSAFMSALSATLRGDPPPAASLHRERCVGHSLHISCASSLDILSTLLLQSVGASLLHESLCVSLRLRVGQTLLPPTTSQWLTVRVPVLHRPLGITLREDAATHKVFLDAVDVHTLRAAAPALTTAELLALQAHRWRVLSVAGDTTCTASMESLLRALERVQGTTDAAMVLVRIDSVLQLAAQAALTDEDVHAPVVNNADVVHAQLKRVPVTTASEHARPCDVSAEIVLSRTSDDIVHVMGTSHFDVPHILGAGVHTSMPLMYSGRPADATVSVRAAWRPRYSDTSAGMLASVGARLQGVDITLLNGYASEITTLRAAQLVASACVHASGSVITDVSLQRLIMFNHLPHAAFEHVLCGVETEPAPSTPRDETSTVAATRQPALRAVVHILPHATALIVRELAVQVQPLRVAADDDLGEALLLWLLSLHLVPLQDAMAVASTRMSEPAATATAIGAPATAVLTRAAAVDATTAPPPARMVYLNDAQIAPVSLQVSVRVRNGTILSHIIPPTGVVGALRQVIETSAVMLANIDRAPLTLPVWREANAFQPLSYFTSSLQNHYTNAAVSQSYKVLGAVSLLGAPVRVVEDAAADAQSALRPSAAAFRDGHPGVGTGRAIASTAGIAGDTSAAVLRGAGGVLGAVAQGLAPQGDNTLLSRAAAEEMPSTARSDAAREVQGTYARPSGRATRATRNAVARFAQSVLTGPVATVVAWFARMANATAASVEHSHAQARDVVDEFSIRPRRPTNPSQVLHAYKLREAEGNALLQAVRDADGLQRRHGRRLPVPDVEFYMYHTSVKAFMTSRAGVPYASLPVRGQAAQPAPAPAHEPGNFVLLITSVRAMLLRRTTADILCIWAVPLNQQDVSALPSASASRLRSLEHQRAWPTVQPLDSPLLVLVHGGVTMDALAPPSRSSAPLAIGSPHPTRASAPSHLRRMSAVLRRRAQRPQAARNVVCDSAAHASLAAYAVFVASHGCTDCSVVTAAEAVLQTRVTADGVGLAEHAALSTAREHARVHALEAQRSGMLQRIDDVSVMPMTDSPALDDVVAAVVIITSVRDIHVPITRSAPVPHVHAFVTSVTQLMQRSDGLPQTSAAAPLSLAAAVLLLKDAELRVATGDATIDVAQFHAVRRTCLQLLGLDATGSPLHTGGNQLVLE